MEKYEDIMKPTHTIPMLKQQRRATFDRIIYPASLPPRWLENH